MIKKINVKSKFLALLLTGSISLTTAGCSSRESHNDSTHNSNEYSISCVERVAHFIQIKIGIGIYNILSQKKIKFYDAKTDSFIVYWYADNDMKLFEFNVRDEDLSYHIGYNVCLTSESNYIYDIVDNTIYKKPDIGGMCESININELYSKDQITANEAEELIETYINYKGDKEKVLAKSK